ncbi:MAG: GDSL-type esterase/lipase family protein [Oscillospiraceae bacterium]
MENKFISADNKAISYMGRIDFRNPKIPVLFYAGSSITLRFKGTSVKCLLVNHSYYYINLLGIIIDGKESEVRLSDVEMTVELAAELENTEHEVIIFKRQAANHVLEFKGFEICGEVLEGKPKPERRIECYGDSVSAGEVCQAIEYTGKCDPENHEGIYDNAWHSYSMVTARNLGAEIHNIAQGGISVRSGYGYFHAPDFIGMDKVYDKLGYIPEYGISQWDFEKYTPDVVIFALGQNDSHHEGCADVDINNLEIRREWKDSYKKIIQSLREKYPNAVFVLIMTVLMHDSGWDSAAEEIADELDDKVYYLKFRRAGKATPGHPRIFEQCEMAEELTAFISNLGDNIWDNR